MEPLKLIAGGVTVLDRADVDTDQIIPAKYLKRVERTGFGEFLFDEWRRDPSFELPKNPILAAGPNFGTGSSREHAPVGAAGLRLPGHRAPRLRRHLLLQLPEDRAAAGADPGGGGARADGGRDQAEVDLEALEIRFAGRAVPFHIEEDRRHRLLNGLDDIALTLQQGEAIAAYEAERERRGPVTTSL